VQKPTKHVYVVVREDMAPPYRAVQACHAGISAARAGLIKDEPNLVVLTTCDERSLVDLANQLKSLGVRHRRFIEADLGDELTAICTEPLENGRRRVFRDFKLLE